MKTTKAKTKPVKKITIHAIGINGSAYLQTIDDRESRALCGVAVWYTTNNNGYEVNQRRPTVQLDLARRPAKDWYGNRSGAKIPNRRACSACRKLALMDLGDREAAIAKREADKKSKSAVDKIKRADSRLEINAELDLKIEAGRIDALVCLDELERSGKYIRRCNRWLFDSDPHPHAKCNLPRDHQYAEGFKCRAKLPGEATHVDIDDVLAIAVLASKRAAGKPDRGTRIYVMRERFSCYECDWSGYNPLLGATNAQMMAKACPDCARVARSDHRIGIRDVVCRFCAFVIDRDCSIGEDYSKSLEVAGHCVPCALKFLAGVVATGQDDTPVLANTLPSASFVLELDQ